MGQRKLAKTTRKAIKERKIRKQLTRQSKLKQKRFIKISQQRLLFSYDVVFPLLRPVQDVPYNFIWNVLEKGYKKSTKMQRYIISYDIIKSAHENLKHILQDQPPGSIISNSKLLSINGFDVHLRKESEDGLCITERGIIYTLLQLSDEQKRRGIITISTGNFAYIVCDCANRNDDIPVTLVMPKSTPKERVSVCRDLGATVIVKGNDMLETHEIALNIAKTEDLFYLDRNHPNMIIGQATFGLDIVERFKEVEVVILPTETINCSLTAAIAIGIKVLKPSVTVIEVRSKVPHILNDNVRNCVMWKHELTNIPVTEYCWCSSNFLTNLFEEFIEVDDSSVSVAADTLVVGRDYLVVGKDEAMDIRCYYAAIAMAPFITGQINNELKGKRILIPIIGVEDTESSRMDQIEFFRGKK